MSTLPLGVYLMRLAAAVALGVVGIGLSVLLPVLLVVTVAERICPGSLSSELPACTPLVNECVWMVTTAVGVVVGAALTVLLPAFVAPRWHRRAAAVLACVVGCVLAGGVVTLLGWKHLAVPGITAVVAGVSCCRWILKGAGRPG